MERTVVFDLAKIVLANLAMFLIVSQLANVMVLCRLVAPLDILWTLV